MRHRLSAVMVAAALLWPAHPGAAGPAPDPARLRQEMARIRRSTNWEDPRAAADANRRITELSQQLMRGAQPDQFDESGKAKAGSQADLIDRSMKAVAGGGTHVDLAASIRAEVEEYDTRQPDYTPRSTGMFEDLETLVIDLSQPQGKATAERLDRFKAVKHLIVTGGEKGAPVDLARLLRKGSALPLEELHVINFRTFLTQVPDSIGGFERLRTLSLVNDRLRSLPASVARLRRLNVLYLDANPISTVFAAVGKLDGLTVLGLARTGVGADEVQRIRRALPNCQVQTR